MDTFEQHAVLDKIAAELRAWLDATYRGEFPQAVVGWTTMYVGVEFMVAHGIAGDVIVRDLQRVLEALEEARKIRAEVAS